MIQNKFDPIGVEKTDVQVDLMDDDVASFSDCIERSKVDPNRTRKMDELEEDQQIYEDIFGLLPVNPDAQIESRPMLMKASLYQHVFSKFEIGAKKIPKLVPVKEGAEELDKAMVGAILDETLIKGGFSETYELDTFPRFKWEGCPVQQIGFEGTAVDFDTPALNEMYFDPDADTLHRRTGGRGKTAKWAVRELILDHNALLGLLRAFGKEDLLDKITEDGTDAMDEHSIEPEQTKKDNMRTKYNVYYGFAVEPEPVFCIFAGRSGTVIHKESGKDYKFIKDGRPVLPFEMFYATADKYGLYCQSWIGVVKDGAEVLKNALNKLLPNLSRAVNPYIFLFGDEGDRTLNEMKNYNRMQESNYTPIIQSASENVRMQSVAPQIDGAVRAFERIRTAVLDDLGQRLRINFRAFEEVEQTATEFVAKETQENRTVAHLNDINKRPFEWIAEFVLDLTRLYASKSDKRKTMVSISSNDTDETFQWTVGELLAVLEEWDGTVMAFTDLKSPMSPAEKRQAVSLTFQRVTELLQALDIRSKEEAVPFINLVYKEVVMNEMEDTVTRQMLVDMTESLIARRQPEEQPQGAQTAQAPAPQGNSELPAVAGLI